MRFPPRLSPAATRPIGLALALLVAAVPVSCIQTESSRLASPADSARIRTARADRAWRLVEGGELRGIVVRFASPTNTSESFYSVRNHWQQELGLVDSLGIAWRYRPHERDAERVTAGTVLEGAIALLEASTACSLEEMELSQLRELRDRVDH